MTKTKEISVFDTKAYKAKLKKKEQNKEYIKKNTLIEKIKIGIYKKTNINTGNVLYFCSSLTERKSIYFKTYDEICKYRKDMKPKQKFIKQVFVNIELNISTYLTAKQKKKYRVSVWISPTQFIKTFNTIEEAREHRNKLIKRQQLIKRINNPCSLKNEKKKKYRNTNIQEKTISKHIKRTCNINTNYTSFTVYIQRLKIYKTFQKLDEAIAFRDNYLKETK